jgi:predicted O-linked N-acetylglucosamine transferase (SPINDLY family)
MRRTLGDDARRIVFLPNQTGDRYFSLVATADVVLDPLHFGGVNTTYDAFSYDQPIVTLPSQYHRGRYTLGCYRWMGLEDFVAASPQQYVDVAVRLGSDRGEKLDAAAKIREAAPILFENASVAVELEQCLLELVEQARSSST